MSAALDAPSTLLDVAVPVDGTGGTRSQVLRWLKRVGDPVRAHEPLVELETDKVTVEISAPADGILHEILKKPDQPAAPGEVLARIATGTAPAAPSPAASPVAAPPAREAVAAPGAGGPAAGKLSPAVRRLLKERQLDPRGIAGTGRDGRITVADVLRFTAAPAMPARPEAAPAPVATAADVERVPHTATRRRIAERMVESLLRTSPHVTTVFELDLGAVIGHRERHKAEFAARGAPLTFTAYFALACVDAIRAVPEANARWTDDALEIHRSIDLGVATALEGRGLVVPVLRGLGSLNLFGVAERLADLTRRAREDRLTPADVRGGTFTISNHGVSGSLVATPIVINPGQSAILGVGKVEKRVVVDERDGGDAIVIRPRCYVTLSIDHRVMDGHRANLFLRTFVDRLERWT
jgi:2-oxoglutarate dehydrogenase E2 component (dihydrolipoamide succinyltransferase)